MDNDTFKTKIECEFVIITNETNTQYVTEVLKIDPDRSFNKGDLVTSKHTLRNGLRPHGLWAISSKELSLSNMHLSMHLEYLYGILNEKIDQIINLKLQNNFEIVFSISIETEDVGHGLDISEFYLSFINKVSNRLSISFISKENIDFTLNT
jgi:hypothetical protein